MRYASHPTPVLRSARRAPRDKRDSADATIPAFDLVVREQRVQGSFAYTNPESAEALGLLESGKAIVRSGAARG